jgi:DNA polymerase-3 subunit gamma/tau
MSIALYRKYRPKSFKEVTGQNHIKITLQNEVETDHIGHAYLFCGPRGTGKTSMARLLAKSVNCLNRGASAEPCNSCDNCQEIMDGRSMDMIEIDAASHTSVDNVRENIIQNARFTPTKSKYKVFIIDEVHMISISAFNALLKTLEEPPKHVIFILATTETHKIPATIISRCQRFDFKRIVAADLVERLRWIVQCEEMHVEDSILQRIAKQVNGCVRDSESLLAQVLSLGGKNITLDQAELILPRSNDDLMLQLFEFIVKKQTSEGIKLANRLITDGVDIAQFLDKFIEFVRKILVFSITKNLEELTRDFDENTVQTVSGLATHYTERDLVTVIERLLRSKDLFKQTNIAQLPLEIAIVDLTAPKTFNDVKVSPNINIPAQIITPTPRPTSAPTTTPTIEPTIVVEEQPTMAQATPATPVMQIELNAEEAAALASIQSSWMNILNTLDKENYSLYMSLKMSKPVALKDNVLTIGFLYDLQRKKAMDAKNKIVAEQLFEKTFNQKIKIDCIIVPNLVLDNNSNGNSGGSSPASVEDVADVFGGTVMS